MPATIQCSCGTTLDEYAVCPSCGGITAQAPARSTNAMQAEEPELPDINVRTMRWVAWELAVAVIAFLVLAGIIYVYARD
jgi:hypothetical protein